MIIYDSPSRFLNEGLTDSPSTKLNHPKLSRYIYNTIIRSFFSTILIFHIFGDVHFLKRCHLRPYASNKDPLTRIIL